MAISAAHRPMSNERVFWVAATYVGDALKQVHRHKAQGVFELLRQALQDQLRNAGMLHEQIGKLPNRTMTLYYQFLDWISPQASLLPVAERCTSRSATGIPIPDFTFSHYPAIAPKSLNLTRSDWPSILGRLQQLHADLGWNRTSTIMWRGDVMNQPFNNRNLPVEHRYRRSRMVELFHDELESKLAELGVSSDVGHAGRLALRGSITWMQRQRASWPDQCHSRYQLHVDGFSYAASLKYRLACGAVVLRISGANGVGHRLEAPLEWFEAVRPLRAGVEYVEISPNMSNLVEEVRQLQRDPQKAQRLSAAAASYAANELSQAAVSSFLDAFLTAYATLFAQWHQSCGRAAAHARVREVEADPAGCAAAAEREALEAPSADPHLRPVVCATVVA